MKNVKRTPRWRLAGVAMLALSGISATAAPALPDDPKACVCRAGGGGFPGPFDGSNLKVELSSGNLYALQGWVIFQDGAPFFQVDLKAHPWLANAVRKDNPFYPLLGSLSFWQGMENRQVQLSAEAEGQATYDRVSGIASYELSLMPIAVYLPHSSAKAYAP